MNPVVITILAGSLLSGCATAPTETYLAHRLYQQAYQQVIANDPPSAVRQEVVSRIIEKTGGQSRDVFYTQALYALERDVDSSIAPRFSGCERLIDESFKDQLISAMQKSQLNESLVRRIAYESRTNPSILDHPAIKARFPQLKTQRPQVALAEFQSLHASNKAGSGGYQSIFRAHHATGTSGKANPEKPDVQPTVSGFFEIN